MTSYKKMYLQLFNAVSDAARLLREGKTGAGIWLLEKAQQKGEEQFVEMAGLHSLLFRIREEEGGEG